MPTSEMTTRCMKDILSTEWGMTSVKEVLDSVRSQVRNDLLTAESNIARLQKGRVEHGGEPTGEIDSLRWFVVVQDLKDANVGATSVITGPIQPSCLPSDQFIPFHLNDIKLTAYAKQRDHKFSKRSTNEISIPRFLSLFLNSSEDICFRDILKKNMSKPFMPESILAHSVNQTISTQIVDSNASPTQIVDSVAIQFCSVPCSLSHSEGLFSYSFGSIALFF
jgi:hypothetical protein